MLNRWLAAGLMGLLALPGFSQDSLDNTPAPDAVSSDAVSSDAASPQTPALPSALIDRMFEMAANDSDRAVRRTTLEACSKLLDQLPRFTATIEQLLDSPDQAKRYDAIPYLSQVDLSAEQKVAAAIRHLRNQYAKGHGIDYRSPNVLVVLRQHSDVTLDTIVEHLNNHGDMPLLYLDMADVFGLDVDKYQPLLIEYSNSQDTAVRQRVAALLANRLDSQIRERERQQKQARLQQQARLNEQRAQRSEAEKYLSYSQRIISRYDANASGSLEQGEWDKMLMPPSAADVNEDGKITVEEYRDYLLERNKRPK
ncbi:hypothetical protein [Roseimaritima ulvae]|uniref:EF-hand domain-containing protein n=1 Tax=Roseimaritima ulvae TaxID=980254 RepID=A0A5B9R8A7_9BACT|nr:hypothetical protein [Roseimaritima ulvae]QEG43001.1 hypothetical protein UC8_50440 [Roseimaritima ulvae]